MDKWLKKPVAKKRKHGEFSYFSYINYMTIYSHKFLTDCKLSELRIALINTTIFLSTLDLEEDSEKTEDNSQNKRNTESLDV